MPIIDVPFKRVAVDLVGPFHLLSEKGHRYILTLVDYATRYPEAIPLKSISTEAVAEALVDIYNRLGVLEEVLSDMGTQFVSECMKEVSRLLRQLTTTPYHPMCNGLVEKFNGTLKTMLRRLNNLNSGIDTLMHCCSLIGRSLRSLLIFLPSSCYMGGLYEVLCTS